MIEAAVVFPVIFLCAIGLIRVSTAMFTGAREDIGSRFETKWKIEKETEWIRNGELLHAQVHR